MEKGAFVFCAIFMTIIGMCIGSFLNVVIYRLPREESILWERSRCPACGHILAWCDLVPLLSYAFLRGKCRSCGAKMSWMYPVVELFTGLLFLLLFCRFGLTLVLAKYLFLSAVLVAAAFIDLQHYIIPDSLVIAGLAGGVVLGALARDAGIISALAGAAACGGFLLLVALLSGGGMGGGDVKLAFVAGLFLGWPLAPLGLFLGICLGGVLAIILLALHIKGRKDPLPFGPFIALGFLIALLWGDLILRSYFNVLW
ncbi:MAG: prepilin peptidase [Thermacetogeniaceae bacterium]